MFVDSDSAHINFKKLYFFEKVPPALSYLLNELTTKINYKNDTESGGDLM